MIIAFASSERCVVAPTGALVARGLFTLAAGWAVTVMFAWAYAVGNFHVVAAGATVAQIFSAWVPV